MTISHHTEAPLRFSVVAPEGTRVDPPAPDEASRRARLERDPERLLLLERQARAAAEVAFQHYSKLQTVTAALSEAVTLQQVADIIVGERVASLGARQGALYLLDAARQHLELVAHRDMPAEHARDGAQIPLDDRSAAASAARSGALIWVTGAEEIAARCSGVASDSDASLHAIAGIPLAVGGRVIGALTLGFDNPHAFPEEERFFTLALVRHCAQAVDRARLYEAERRANRRLELLAKAGDLLSSSIDYETTLENVARLAVPSLADFCFFDVVEGTTVRRIARAHGDPELQAALEGARFSLSEPADVEPRSVRAGRAGFHPEIDDRYLERVATGPEHLALLRRLAFCSLVTVPLLAREQTLGSLTLCFAASGRRHTVADRELSEELACRAAIAVENALLHRASREATERAQEANRRSELANRTKDEFLGVVSHELRTPLNAVLGWAQLLRGQGARDPTLLAKGLKVIDRNARAQAKLIEDILDVSRIVTGKLRLDPRPIELEGVVRCAVEVIRPAADAKGVQVRAIVERPAGVTGDPDRLQQVVWNLLSNAVKFTPRGGSVDIHLARRGIDAEILVRDSGPGIDADFLPFVFDRFRQADAAPTRRHGGLGLGLAIVRHLVEAHGGTVCAESEGLNRGSTFTVRLPLLEDHVVRDVDTGNTQARDLDPGPLVTRLAGLKVLVVDDEPDARELIAAMLGSSGAEVSVAGSSSEAQRMLGASTPDVLVSDVGMPGEDGYALIRKIRGSGTPAARVPALALTAYASQDDAHRALDAGFHTHLPKPAEASTLTAAVARLGGRAAGPS